MPIEALDWSGTIHGRPRAEVLDAADLDARLVDVDPVVREQVLAVDDQRDRQEVAVAQALGRGLDRAGRGGALASADGARAAAATR